MNSEYKTLKEFGLKENEIKVYLETLKHDELTPFQISKVTKIPRTTVYDVLLNLSLKGLIELDQSDGFTKQRTLVKAKNPSILREILQSRRKELVNLELDILEILPNIKSDFHKKESGADFRFYPGIEGAKEVYFSYFMDETTDVKLPLLEWDLLMPMDAFGMAPVNKDVSELIERRKKQKHVDKTIVALNDWTKHVLTYQTERDADYLKNNEYRFVENASFEINTVIGVRGEYVKMVCAKENEMWGLKFKSKMLAMTLNSIFMQNWETASPLTKEMVESWGPNEFSE